MRKLDPAHGDLTSSRLIRLLHKITKRKVPLDKEGNLPLAKLSDVLVVGCYDEEPNEPDLLCAYLKLPSTRRVHGFRLGYCEEFEQTEGTRTIDYLGEGTSPVEELELRQSQLHSEDLERVLRACKNLKPFIYGIGTEWTRDLPRTSHIMEALSPQKETLVNMVLGMGVQVAIHDDEFSPVSFTAFKRLAYLKIENHILYTFGLEEIGEDCGL